MESHRFAPSQYTALAPPSGQFKFYTLKVGVFAHISYRLTFFYEGACASKVCGIGPPMVASVVQLRKKKIQLYILLM